MKFILAVLISCLGSASSADHVPVVASDNPFEHYQFDAANKRYADILIIADLIENYIETTGTVPQLSSGAPASGSEPSIYEVAVLGQPETVDAVFQNGTPFEFSLIRYRPDVLLDVLSLGLERPVLLPIDPQRVGTNFAPAYFVFFRRPFNDWPAHYIVLGTFAQPVARSTMVGQGVHLVAISNEQVPFIVPVQSRESFDATFSSHILESGREADTLFMRNVPIHVE